MSFKGRCLGVDPGLANTGFAIVSRRQNGYELHAQGVIRTQKRQPEPERLKAIYDHLRDVLEAEQPDRVCIERCFHNRNVSSSMETAGVIGIVKLLAVQFECSVYVVIPQEVKSASGLGWSAKKSEVQSMMCKIFAIDKLNNHVADAAAAAIVGVLKQ